ncbi:unnamed protein product [Rotaria socialis]|uniref:MULE transposase domain-containing protein n=1 Tax=Rotaria socialis TaxID=392032 RepID=A0A818B7H5_9BILA|nr:unnamed protein product [Rotaria socialis]
MPITTRAAALLRHAAGEIKYSVRQTRAVEQSIPEQQLHEQQTKSLMSVEYDRYHDSKHSISDTHLSIADLFAPPSLAVTKTYEVKTSEQSNQQPAPHHPQSCRSMSPTSPSCSVPIALLVSGTSSSDENQNDSSFGDVNAMLNVPIGDGYITTGTSERGGRMIFLNGYSYLAIHETEHCKAVIHTSKVTSKFSHWNGQSHIHIVDQTEIRKRSILTKIKARVVDKYISVTVIVEDEYRKAQLSYEEKRAMPFPLSLASGLQKLRRNALPPLPSDQRFVIPPAYQTTYGSELFLIYDKRKSAHGGRLLIFGSEEQLNVLFADGTFKVCPKLFEQLYVIIGLKNGEAVPVCFIFTSNRRHESYEAVFRCLKKMAIRMGCELKPSAIVCDFERAFINAVVKEVSASPHSKELKCFLSYFKSEWLNTFQPSTWSVGESTWRTNNYAEAQNHRLYTRVIQPHPNLWRFLQCLKQEESVISHRMVQTGLGFSAAKAHKSTRAAARKSKQIVKLLNLLALNQRSLVETISSFAYIVGGPVGRKILNPDKLRSKALQNGQPTSTSINIRRLIDRILTHYSSDFVVFRELIQNADDAGATSFHLEIKCDASSASSAETHFNNCTITEIRAINNGHVFSTADWQRVATIADGNIDPESVGQFGVGFFSVFSYAEEPIIVSGKEYMIFIWQDNKFLQTLRHKLLVEQQTKTTSIILKMRDKYILRIESILDNSRITNEDVPTINLTQLKAYFAKALSFTRNMMTLDIKVNQLLVFQMSKTKSIMSSVLNPFTFKPHRSIHNMLLLDSFVFTEQTFAITNGPSITLGHITIEAHLNIDQQLRNYFQRILKTLPSTVQIQLLFVPTKILLNQQQFQSLITSNNLDAQILKSILPLTFLDNEIIPSGLIFIGLGTHQSIGIGMHVCSHFIPTVERDTLDLQDAYAAKWNEELIACVGQIARCIYDQEISHSSHNRLNKNYETIMAPYSFQKTAPSEKVGAIILKGFFALKNDIFVPTKRLPSANHLSLVISTQTFLADSKHIHGFLPLPLVPFELSKSHFFTALKEHSLIHMADKSIIEESLTSSALLSNELIELLKWLCSSDINDHSYTKRVLSVVRYHETINSPISYFGKLKYYDALNISLVLPLPSNVLPISIAEHFSQEQLHHNLFLLPCNFKQLIDFYLSENQQYLFNNVKTATHLLSYLSNSSSHFSEPEWKKIKDILSIIKCIPTTHGMKLPRKSYLPSHILRSDRPAITLNLLAENATDSRQPRNDSNENLVSVYFLKKNWMSHV